MVLERLLWRLTCPTHASFRLLTVARRVPGTHKEVDLTPHPVVGLVLKVGDAEKFPRHLVSKAWILFFLSFFLSESASRFHVSQPHRRMEVTRYL